MVGMMYLNGEGTVKDPAEAVRWQRKGAELGSPKSWFELGLYTLYGQNGMEKNVAEGLRLITKAAEAGFADAENQLGYMYVTGSGVAQDLRQAAVWYRKSADQGDSVGLYNTGLLYRDGNGTGQDWRALCPG